MIFAEKSQLMLKYQKAKAKLVEYEVNKNEYPHFPLNSNELSYPTTYILSRYAESVIEQDNEAKHHFGEFLTNTAQYYDAAVNSEDRANYDVDFLISGAVAYFLANDFGSAKVLLQKVYSKIDLAEKSPHVFIVRMLAFLLNNNQISQLDGDDLYCNLNNAIRKYYGEGEGKEYIATLLSKYRQEVYAEDNVNDVFFVDLFVAMMMTAIEKAAWELLPIYTKSHNGEWMDYLHNKSSIKMLWPAQQLIGASNLLQGANGIVQLPTGVGKTKSIELIIRSSFIAGRASTVVIVAPLRALCNEITTDMVKTFGADVKINQLSDVLQEDIILFDDPSNKQIAICTPEKLSYILHHQKDIVNLIDLFVFDEAHMFDDGERGATYELLVTYIKETINEEQQLILSKR